tara:strand:- start:3320 stop:3502 length:183 start_codon:yes stop_codon:yes gene_type:complete
MTRPHKIREPTITYNCNIQVTNFEKLRQISADQSRHNKHQVAIADLIRQAVDEYLKKGEQ